MKKAEFELKVNEKLVELGFDLNKKETGQVTDSVFQVAYDLVSQGEEVPLGTLGKLTTSERAARKGRNPQTGEEIDIAASVVPKFKPSKSLKDTLKSK
ncbi:HU family DNA-binding protein [Cytobacillus praedii]|uniref:HU family DNA-binding protein n=1 Tax=Cytobacillus praedii TaxID=1742358 RepID=A0A4R1AMW0_9BACI|nr:HU family DNA-binding protein [Cytobacillus praedii]TCJ01115.1 HU family DNA-binding protein [Cytobacillus praedii]